MLARAEKSKLGVSDNLMSYFFTETKQDEHSIPMHQFYCNFNRTIG